MPMRNRKRNLIGSFTVSKASKKKANVEFSGAGLEEGYAARGENCANRSA
jgi:hypothetical protein